MATVNYKMLGFFNRKFKITEKEPPPDVKAAFAVYATDGSPPFLAVDQLRRFLVESQGERGCTVDDVERIVREILQQRQHHLTKHKCEGLTIDDFFHYLFCDDLNGPVRLEVHHDMTAPLQHYFIFTGHNSYLTGNQLTSDCSDLPIIKALQKGVRVIELDIWPNSAKDGIDVFHGRTLTTPVPLINCFKSIKEYAFVKSPYPLIITLEDHLTPDLQAKVAEMVLQIFGDMLYYPESECLVDFPSPEALKHRIVLSTKPPKEYLESKNQKIIENISPKDKISSDEDLLVKESTDLTYDVDSDVKSNDVDDNEDSDECETLGAPQYHRLIGIHAGKPKDGLKHALNVGCGKMKRLSLSESALEKATDSHASDIVRFTNKNMLRVYPKGTRVTSSNFKPLTAWMHGAQMVAANIQVIILYHPVSEPSLRTSSMEHYASSASNKIKNGYGKSLYLMHGMFRSNGGCGYVKKPDFLMKKYPNGQVFDPKASFPVKKTLKVKIYMGDGWRLDFKPSHFDTYSPPDFYVKLYILGVPGDLAKTKTKIIEDDWAPVWDEEFNFPLTVPELALIRIVVREHDRSEKDDFGGQTCLPVWELKKGIRAVSLYDKKGEKLKSVKLLMRFEFV